MKTSLEHIRELGGVFVSDDRLKRATDGLLAAYEENAPGEYSREAIEEMVAIWLQEIVDSLCSDARSYALGPSATRLPQCAWERAEARVMRR